MSDTRTFYKWLSKDGEPFHGGRGRWPLPTQQPGGAWTPGEPLRVEGRLKPCTNGLHLCREADLLQWCAPTLWVVQYRGEIIEAEDKVVVREARLLQRLDTWNDRTARLLAADCAERALRLAKMTDPRSWNAIEVARRYAVGQCGDEERAAAWDAAWAAAWAAERDAAWAAAWAAARAAARAAAWAAARAAAWAAARAAGRAAARDAASAAERHWQTARLMAHLRGDPLEPVA